MTVKQALARVSNDGFVLPGLQRSFVWQQQQIIRLFDSLLRGYPIGSFLVWQTTKADNPGHRFYRLHTKLRGGGGHGSEVRFPPRATVMALLDGQQRVTALNIGLRASVVASETAVPRTLYLNLDEHDESAGAESMAYSFAFHANHPGLPWFPVHHAMDLGVSAADLNEAMRSCSIRPSADRRKVLGALARAVSRDTSSTDAVAATSDLDRVLNIFSRANTGGTKLAYVDLLVSMATTKLTVVDPTREFPLLKEQIAQSDGFDLSIDRIVKAALILLDKDPKLHADTFLKPATWKRLDSEWSSISESIHIAAELLRSFGLRRKTLSAENVLLPIAYYLHHHQPRLGDSYVHSDRWIKDRALVRAFVARTLLQRGYWTGAVDPVLRGLRLSSRSTVRSRFPSMNLPFPLGTLSRLT